MVDFIKSREQLINFFRGEMHGPLDYSSTSIPKESINRYKIDDELSFESFREASLPAIQDDGNEILNLVSPLGDEQPTRRYGIGVLYPFNVHSPDEENSDERQEEFFADKENETDDLAIDKKAKERINRINEKGAKKKTKGDFVESVADVRTSNIIRQSSMGISFFVDLPKDGRIKIFNHEGRECGIYKKALVDIKENTSSNDHHWWLRRPVSLDFDFETNNILEQEGDAELKPTNETFKMNDLAIECKLITRKLDNTNLRLITVFLVNRSLHSSSNDEVCLFQSNFHVAVFSQQDERIDCIKPYPEGSVMGENENKDKQDVEEDESLDLVFRNKKTFAIGHGCSADWEQVKGQELASEVFATHFPIYEAANITPDVILDEKDKSLFVLPMSLLAGIDNSPEEDIFKLLNVLCSLYESWIRGNEGQIQSIPEKYQKSAKLNTDKCLKMLERIKNGISFLKNDSKALEAFKLANLSILTQQVRTKRYKDDERDWELGIDGRIKPKIEYEEPDLLETDPRIGKWRPFQVAFMLCCLESTVLGEDSYRENVELIFFPTGGGKTEAYLGLISFLGFYRRLTNIDHKGVDVIMRYTLRLLTTQQFTRAASLICAMEKIRQDNTGILGENEFSIGVWLGQATTPNRKEKARSILKKLQQEDLDEGDEDPFLITKCPWCSAGMGLVPINKPPVKGKRSFPKLQLIGIVGTKDTVKFLCQDSKCHFSKNYLPIYVIDDDVYEKTPTILIATVDKFAQVAWMPDAKSIFGFDKDGNRANDPPGLILQDELHLITGPLGSMFGLYETLIEDLCTDKRKQKPVKPKIICSTATIRRYAKQVESLYNRKNNTLFPPLGIYIEDNFFGHYKYDESGELENPKKFIGIHASSLGSTQTAQVRVYASLLQSVMFMEEEERDPWFTLMNFFGSIRELATTLTLLETDIPDRIGVFFKRFNLTVDQIRKIGKGGNETLELTSRLKNQEVPKAINKLEKSSLTKGCVDVCLASNIIEVGVDIDRLSLLTIFGQPKTTSSYIQVSGRIGRKWDERPGLVVTIYGPMRPRDKSHFEKFKSYHQRLYAQVEPSSVTPFSKPVLERALHALMVGYVRMVGDANNGEFPLPYPENLLDDFYSTIQKRIKDISNDKEEMENFKKIFSDNKTEWKNWKRAVYAIRSGNSSNPLMHSAGSYVPRNIAQSSWATPTSLRNVDAECMTYVTSNYRVSAADEEKEGVTND